jgi:dTDP-4-dehydrorhamnose reductase
MRIAIIGKNGQLARCLAEERPDGVDAIFLSRDQFDLAMPAAAMPVLEQVKPDLVINAAAYTAVDKAESEPEAAFAINRDGAAAVAAFCGAHGLPLIHISTDYVFDGGNPAPYREDAPPAPLNVYGASKLAGELAVREAARRVLILRTSWVYSAYGQNFVKTMMRLAEQRGRVRVVADQHGCPTSAHDLARAVWHVARTAAAWPPETPFWGIYHYAGHGATTWAGFAEAIFATTGPGLSRTPAIERITSGEYPTPAARPQNSVLDCSKFQQIFHLAPRPWRQSLSTVMGLLLRRNADERHHSSRR